MRDQVLTYTTTARRPPKSTSPSVQRATVQTRIISFTPKKLSLSSLPLSSHPLFPSHPTPPLSLKQQIQSTKKPPHPHQQKEEVSSKFKKHNKPAKDAPDPPKNTHSTNHRFPLRGSDPVPDPLVAGVRIPRTGRRNRLRRRGCSRWVFC